MSEENVEIVGRAYESLARRDWDGLWAGATKGTNAVIEIKIGDMWTLRMGRS